MIAELDRQRPAVHRSSDDLVLASRPTAAHITRDPVRRATVALPVLFQVLVVDNRSGDDQYRPSQGTAGKAAGRSRAVGSAPHTLRHRQLAPTIRAQRVEQRRRLRWSTIAACGTKS